MITFDEKLEAAWGLHKIEKAVLEKEIAELRAENGKFFKQAEMNARLLTENASLRGDNENLRLKLDMQQATILVPSQKDDQRRIERLTSALKEALDEAAALRAQIYRAEKAVAEIEKLRKILQALINDIEDYEHINNITPKFSKLCCVESIRNAREILKK